MKDLEFLSKLKKEEKLGLIEPTDSMSGSYVKKSKDCLSASKLLLNGNLFENSIGEAYYSMYNSLQSLFFKCGIKCENHTASAILLNLVFKHNRFYTIFLKAKGDRIDKQYNVLDKQIEPATKESAQKLIVTAETFIFEVDDYKRNLSLHDINSIRKTFGALKC